MNLLANNFFDEAFYKASMSSKRRQHINLHQDYLEPCQRLFNVILPDSYIRPHQHNKGQGVETLIVIHGEGCLVTFYDDGRIKKINLLNSYTPLPENDSVFGVEIPSDCWHTIVPSNLGLILLEIKRGPFDLDLSKTYAPWAPAESSEGAIDYFYSLKGEILKRNEFYKV